MSDEKFTQLPLDFEIWKPIPGYEGLYEVSDQGQLRRVAGSPRCSANRILHPHVSQFGYKSQYLRNQDKKGKNLLIHRAVMAAFVGPVPDGCEINHKNGSKADNRLENLEYVTRSENTYHSYRVLGNKARHGNAHPFAKITEDDVREIRSLVDAMTYREIAERFGIDTSSVHAIVHRKNWKHVK